MFTLSMLKKARVCDKLLQLQYEITAKCGNNERFYRTFVRPKRLRDNDGSLGWNQTTAEHVPVPASVSADSQTMSNILIVCNVAYAVLNSRL